MVAGMMVPLVRLAGFVLVAACLYWAQAVFIPLALGVLLTFLLSPLATALQRHISRVPAVVVVMVLLLALVGSVGYVLTTQVVGLGLDLPKYETNIKEKIADIRLLGQLTGIERVQRTVTRAAGEVEREAGRLAAEVRKRTPTPVEIVSDGADPLRSLLAAAGPWAEALSRAGFVILLVPFMLLARDEMRNRLVRLMGLGRLAVTTRAMDEAGERVTRYLLMQSFFNTTFAVLATVGLYLIGVPYAMLFGFLAGALRFVPYVGIWIGAGLPVVVCMAVYPGWTRALLVIGLFAVLELFVSAVLEVLLYARSAGVSEVGLLVAIAFWTWMWGPVGLVLATPLTVCIVVLAKNVPELEFLWVLMGDEPAVSAEVAVYQRLLAEDRDEASDIVEQAVEETTREQSYDEVLLATLALAQRDYGRGRIDAGEQRAVVDGVAEILEQMEPAENMPAPRARVFGAPARHAGDAVALHMLRELLAPARVALDVASTDLLSAEVVRIVREQDAAVVVVGALAPGGLAQARFLCKRMRTSAPGVRIVVGRWGFGDDAESARRALQAAGADAVGASLRETRDLVLQFVRAQPQTVVSRPA
jgi:predicted PurR-regulated permease PerM